MKIKRIIFFVFLVLFGSCKDNNITEPPGIPALPDLADAIPYYKLGSGKVLFQRIGPMGNNYEGLYVIDISNQISWGIKLAPVDAPQISPAGDRIAFTKYTNLESAWDVNITDLNGNNGRQISSVKGQERCPTWLPNNQEIIYYSYCFAYNDDLIPAYLFDIINGTTRKIIDFVKIAYPYCYDPCDIISVSSKGVSVASIPAKGICTFGIDGKNFKTIIKKSEEYFYYSPTWNPAGDKIAVMALRTDSSFLSIEMNIILFNQDGSDSTRIFNSQDNEVGGSWSGNNNYSLCWSPDGSKILFNKREGYLTSHIYVINADGADLTIVTSLTGVTDRSLSWGK